jgi:outer membrane protein
VIRSTDQAKNGHMDEQTLTKLYMDLTGASEATARSVLMYVTAEQEASQEPAGGLVLKPVPENEEPLEAAPRAKARTHAVTGLMVFWLGLAAWSACAAAPLQGTNGFITRPLSLADAVNVALSQNPNILRAQKDVEATEGVVVQTKAIAIPQVQANGSYSAVALSDTDIISATAPAAGVSFNFGSAQNWVSQIKVVQSLYEGGRILSSFRVGRLTRQRSMLDYQTAVADTVVNVEVAYYDTLLAAQEITVQQASVNLLSNQLADTTRRYDAGTVPRFNVLRAEVELANARPRLIRAQNDLRIAKNGLANLLGLNVPLQTQEDIPLTLSGKLEAPPFQIELPRAIALALAQRTELESLRKTEALRKEEVVAAKAGYKPSVQLFAGYDAHNSLLHSDLGWADHGWITGAQVTWNIFDGFRTKGRVVETKALYQRAGIDLDDTARRIELEVRTAHSTFIEADEVLKSQAKVVEQAEEALRLASARYEAGTGTQLDVLSAQTALTEARTTQVRALRDYAVARARLERAIGMNVPQAAKRP